MPDSDLDQSVGKVGFEASSLTSQMWAFSPTTLITCHLLPTSFSAWNRLSRDFCTPFNYPLCHQSRKHLGTN